MNWNFKMIYKNEEEFQKDNEFLRSVPDKLAVFKGKLNDKKCLEEYFLLNDEIELKLSKQFSYLSMQYDLNQKDTKALTNYQMIYGLYMDIISASSFVESELIEFGYDNIKKLYKESEIIARYSYYFDKLFNSQSHVLDAKSELLLSHFNSPLSDFNKLYDQLAVADNNSVKVTLSDGTELDISNANYTSYLATTKNQEDRKKIFEAVYKYYDLHKNTFASIYKGIIDSNIARMKARNYDSILSLYLSGNKIPNEVFLNLVDVVHNNTEYVKKYYDLRRKFFKLDRLYTYDRFLEMSNYVKNYSYEEAKELYYKAIDSLGKKEFSEIARYVTEEGRIDVEIKDGKRTGAYSTGTYDNGPFILLNFTHNLDDVFTLAHECGHSGHTTLANKNQPVNTADYTIFVAEVASTFNEQLLLDYLLKNSHDKELKISILQNAIDGLIATFYRQTLFGEYEYIAHNKAIAGEGVTSDSLSQIMIDLYKEYYGHDLLTEDYKRYVWCYIPHLFHSPFYVYQYATSFSASLNIYQRVKNNEENAYENYIKLLSSGGSDYPVNLLQKAGVDLTKKDAYLSVVERLKFLVNELEKVLGE